MPRPLSRDWGGVTAGDDGAPAGRFRLFGLVVDSQVPLSELVADTGGAPPDVRIALGPEKPVGGERGITAAGDGLLFTLPGLACYTVSGGTDILVEPAPGASGRDLRLYLLGSVFGALLHQRGLLPLHANAIEVGGRAVAFMGASGAGKSTLANWFGDRGHRVLADDVCVVRLEAEGPLAEPGLPRLRLWRDALATSGRDAAEYRPSFDGLDKYDVPTGKCASAALPLVAVYLLGRSDAPGIVRFQGAAAVEALVANTYRGAYVPLVGATAGHFAACVRLARQVPVFAAERTWGFDCFDAQAERLRLHAEGRAQEPRTPRA